MPDNTTDKNLYLCTVKVEVSEIKMESQQGCEDKERIKEDKGG